MLFISVAIGVTTTMAETNQTTNDFHVHQLGTSSCPDSDIVWSDVDVRLGCIVMTPSLDCTNMARRHQHLSEFADEDAMQDHHRALKEHVINNIAGGGGGNAAIDHNHRNLIFFQYLGYFASGYVAGQATCPGWRDATEESCVGNFYYNNGMSTSVPPVNYTIVCLK